MPKARHPRKCPECGKVFKAMTDAQWELVLNKLHRPMSLKHRQVVARRVREQ